VLAAALHKVPGQHRVVLLAEPGQVQPGQLGAQQAQEGQERGLDAAVRGGRQQHQVALRVIGEFAHQGVALLARAAASSLGRLRCAVRLVHEQQIRAILDEGPPVVLALDQVDTGHKIRIILENTDVRGYVTLQARQGAGANDHRIDTELVLQLLLPLVAQIRRAQDAHATDIAPVEQFAHNQARLDRLANPDVIRDQQAHRLLLQGHHQRHELVQARAEGDVPEAAERSRAVAQQQARRLLQQPDGGQVLDVGEVRQPEGRRLDALERQAVGHLIGQGAPHAARLTPAAPDGPEQKEVRILRGQHYPLTFAVAHQSPGSSAHRRASPNMSVCSASCAARSRS